MMEPIRRWAYSGITLVPQLSPNSLLMKLLLRKLQESQESWSKTQGANKVVPIALNDCFLFLTVRSPVNGVYHVEKALMWNLGKSVGVEVTIIKTLTKLSH